MKLAACVLLVSASACMAQSYDLRQDWSETQNPNGAWSFVHGASTLLPHVSSWQRNAGGWAQAQPAWAMVEDGPGRVPMFYRSNGSEEFSRDYIAGDIVTHTTDPGSGGGNGQGAVLWTSPGQGYVTIFGSLWLGRDIGRAVEFELSRGPDSMTSGSLFTGDPYSRSSPFRLQDASGGPEVLLNLPVVAGEVVRLEIRQAPGSPAGDFAGIELAMTFQEACLADCDQSTGPGALDIFDFLCFQNWFAFGDRRACNCDLTTGPSVCDIFDFLCFQTHFANGCP